jgi:hypothetical protein
VSAPSGAETGGTLVSPVRAQTIDEAARRGAEERVASGEEAARAHGGDTMTASELSASAAFDPDVVHRARIAMARAALVEDNLNKARVDLAEELQRELAALQTGENTKSRTKHGKGVKKEP